MVAVDAAAGGIDDRSIGRGRIGDDDIREGLIAGVADDDLVVGILTDLHLFWAIFGDIDAALADVGAPLARSRLGIAGSDDGCVADAAPFDGSEGDVDLLILAGFEFAEAEGESTQVTAVFDPFGDIVGDDDIFGSAATAVADGDRVVDDIARGYFCRATLAARQHGSSTQQRAEAYRRRRGTEASAQLAFGIATEPYFSGDGLSFAHGADIPD